jgi:DNA polymerase-4
VALKIRDPAFVTLTRRKTLAAATDRSDELWQAAAALYEQWRRQRPAPVRLIGVGVTGLTEAAGRQLGLFDERERQRQSRLDNTLDQIRERYGDNAIKRAANPPEDPDAP